MARSSGSRNTMLVAGLVALVYASLAVMAASCAFSHVDASNGHTHHGAQAAGPHNALCAWACQATSDAGLGPESPALATGPVAQLLVSSFHPLISSSCSSLLHSRAPPSAHVVLIG
jgi:hypothetical protein